MNLDKSYWNAMDKEAAEQYLVNPTYLGITAAPFEKQLGQLKTRIFEGASNVELGFMGKGKGSIQGGNITPGMHSKEEREDMRQLAKFNEVGLTTHASANAMGMAGFSRDGTFNEHEREKNVNEVKRAIDFAADVAEGGPVVLHTGEFSRPIYGTEKTRLKEKFIAYPEERERMTHFLVNKRDGKVYQAVRENETLVRPVYKLKDGKRQQRLDANGKPMKIHNPITGEDIPVFLPDTDINGNILVERVPYKDFKKECINKGIAEERVPLMFFWEMRRRDMESHMGQADEYEILYTQGRKAIAKLKELRKEYEKLEKGASEEGLERLKQNASTDAQYYLSRAGGGVALAPATFKKPTELIKAAMWLASKNMSYGVEIGTSARRQLEKVQELLEDTVPIEEYAMSKTADSIARAAVFAYDKEKAMKLKKPLYVAPENVFPEQYGSHPDELKEIIIKSREAMVDKLVKQKSMSRGAAKKVAEDHVRATIDVGHLNTWRKYFEGTDKEFKTWIVDKTKGMIKSGLLGHIHLSDNFGYEDEHVAPGEGTAPIKEFIEELRKQGYKDVMIVEPGAQDKGKSLQALTTAMRHFNSPIYEIEGASVGWADIEHGYFGRVLAGPPYVVGAYAPDVGLPTEHRTWTFWSGVPME